MTHHPYWSYGPNGDTPVVDALNEGRRAFALEKALQSTGFALNDDQAYDRTDEVLANAARIEAYLAGRTETAAERLADLEKSERKLVALETAGVDNWSGYDEAVADLDDED